MIPWKSTTTAGSLPITQASWPEGNSETSPGRQSNSAPSSILIRRTPDTWYWKCGASQLLVFTSGCTDVDHFQPGSKTARPTVAPPILMSSSLPFGNSRTSSGLRKSLHSAFSMSRLRESRWPVSGAACAISKARGENRKCVGPRSRPAIARRRCGRGARLELGEQATGDRLEARDLTVGARKHHRAFERADQRARDVEGRAGELQRAAPTALLEDRDEPALVLVEEMAHLVLHRLRQRGVLGGEHAAQAHPVVAQHIRVDLRVPRQLLRGVAGGAIDLAERREERTLIPRDEAGPELRLRGKVIVEACFRDLERPGDVRVAEAVEPARLDEALGHVQDPLGGAAVGGALGHGWHSNPNRRRRTAFFTYKIVDRQPTSW